MFCGGVTLRSWREGEVLVIRANVEASGSKAVLVDMRDADPEATPAAWLESAGRVGRNHPSVPVAMVVRPEHFEDVVQHCIAVARSGLNRMAFMEMDPAITWCQFEIDRARQEPAVCPVLRPAAGFRTSARLRLVHPNP